MSNTDDQQDRNAKWRAKRNAIERHKCADPSRRKRLEKDDAKWLRFYFAEAYPRPFGPVHVAMIKAGNETLDEGGKALAKAPRGSAKSSVFWGLVLKWLVTSKCPFPAYLPWASKDKRKALRFWQSALCFNPVFAADYPEFCDPFAVSRGSSQKCKALTWADNGEPTGAELLLSDGMIVMPDALGVIGSSTINGNPKGMNHPTKTGKIWRPTAALIDDAQSKKAAKSQNQVDAIIDVIETDIAGMAGPMERMPIFLLGTLTCQDDVVDRISKRRDWKVVTISQIVAWPKRMDLWDAFGELIKDQREPEALAIYKANKTAMLECFAVSWAERFDRKRKEPDAFYSAMRDFYFMGRKAFMLERQGVSEDADASLYSLTAEIVMAHAVNTPRLVIPDNSTVFVGYCDLNNRGGGPHFATAAFDQLMTGHCPLYGTWSNQDRDIWAVSKTQQQMDNALYAAMQSVCDRVAASVFMHSGTQRQPSTFWFDASWMSDTVHRFVRWANQSGRYKFKVLPCIGRAAHKYYYRRDTLIGRPFEGGHVQRAQNDPHKVYAMINADYWRETMQRAFLAPVGAAGGFTLHYCQNTLEHLDFASQIIGERLSNKYETEQGWRWEWKPNGVGVRWDWGDALAGCWAAAAAHGLCVGGIPVVKRKYVETRKAKVRRE